MEMEERTEMNEEDSDTLEEVVGICWMFPEEHVCAERRWLTVKPPAELLIPPWIR